MRRVVPTGRVAGLADSSRGLTTTDAEERLSRYGGNAIVEAPPSGWRQVARDTARDPMVWFLVATALLFVWLGDFVEAAVLAAALVPIAGMDAYLHRRTQATTEGLAGRLASVAHAVRDGTLTEIPAAALVPGDLVIVREGMPFPADGLIVVGDGLQVDESSLTGEAMPVRKHALAHAALQGGDTAVEDTSWGAAGTRLLTGEAMLRVIYTGGETLYGQIVRSAHAGRHERTPLQQAIASLVTILMVIAIILCLALAAVRYQQGYGVIDAILSAVTLAVAALPEEFPVVFTFFLGLGVYRLAQRQALVRRAVVVENIGRITCICTDKTGTLTEGRLRLGHVVPAPDIDERLLLSVAATAARAESRDPLDEILLGTAAPVAGHRAATYPFTEDRRREVAIIQKPQGGFTAAIKGAPETVLSVAQLAAEERELWHSRTRELADTGHKVIACAYLELESWPGGEPDRGYSFLGLLAFEDPPRPGVAAAVARAKAAGLKVIMVTGDHPATATAIARELGIGQTEGPRVIEGPELADRLRSRDGVQDIDIIARAIPTQKLDLVRALQGAGEIVAVTGDGVNDVPALQGADIGIAMGERGTRTAREVASIVLLDDNFQTIIRAIAEGRQLFRNLKLSFAYLLMVHAPLVTTAALIPLFGFPLLYLPVHIVWLELIIHPTAMLVFQFLPSSDALEPVERKRRIRFFDLREWAAIGAVGALLTALVAYGYLYSLGERNDVLHGRSMAIVALISGSAMITAVLSRLRSRGAVVAVAAAGASAAILIQAAPIAQLLHLSPLHFIDWLIAMLGGVVATLPALLILRTPRRRNR